MAKKRTKQRANTERKVKDYEDRAGYSFTSNAYYSWRNNPPFVRFRDVPAMQKDPRLSLAMSVLKGMALSLPKFWVEPNGTSEEIKQFVVDQIQRFWTVGAACMLDCMDWGWSAAEVLYAYRDDGLLRFNGFTKLHAQDVMPVTLEGEYAGLELRSQGSRFLGGQYSFWTVHDRECNRWWGRSRYESAFIPWNEMYDRNGALDIRRLYFYRKSISPEVARYPDGSFTDEHGVTVSNRDVMRTLVENARSGGSYVLPSTTDEKGNFLWSIETRDQGSSGITQVREYVEDLRNECTEGIGVSPELIKAAETGSGFSGRKIPEQAVRGILSQVVFWLINDFDEQVIKYLVRHNFGVDATYEIIPFGMTDEEEPVGPDGVEVPQGVEQNFKDPRAIVA